MTSQAASFMVGWVLLMVLETPVEIWEERSNAVEASSPKTQVRGYQDFREGISYAQQEQYAKAVEAFNRAEGMGFMSFELLVLRGNAHFEMAHFKEALIDAGRAIDSQPTSPYGHSLRARIHQGDEQWEQATQDASRGIALVPSSAAGDLYRARGINFLYLGNPQVAMNDLSQALQLGVVTPLVYFKRGRAFTELGRYPEAIDDFSEALRRQDNHYKSRLHRGWVYGCLGEFEKSLLDLNRLASDKPGDAVVHGMRGWIRLESGDVDGALSDLEYAVKNGDRNPSLYVNVASALYLKGSFTEALEANGKAFAFKDNANDAAVYFQRGLLLLVIGRVDEGKRSRAQRPSATFWGENVAWEKSTRS